MKRGHIFPQRGFGAEVQRKALEAGRVRQIYMNDIKAVLRSLRKGDALYVHTFRGLGNKKKLIAETIKAIHAKGAHAVDVATGGRSDGPDGALLTIEALVGIAQSYQGGRRNAEDNGAEGGKIAAANRRKQYPPKATLERYWFNKTMREPEIMEQINALGFLKMHPATVRRMLGPRRVTPGRRPKE